MFQAQGMMRRSKRTGVVETFVNGEWVQSGAPGMAQQPMGGPEPLISLPPDPAIQQGRQLDNQAAGVTIAKGMADIQDIPLNRRKTAADTANSEYSARTKPTYDRFGALDKIRNDVRSDKRIAAFESSLPVWASGLRAPGTPEGDQLLVNTFAKTLDPLTGVQQGEGNAIASNASSLEQLRARLGKEFGTDEAGNFTPEGRQRIKQAITTRMRELATSYNQGRDYWRGQIANSGIPGVNPDDVLGRHVGADFQQVEADFNGRPIRNLNNTAGAVPATGNYEEVLRRTLTDPRLPPEQRLAAARRVAQQFQRPFNEEQAMAAAQGGAGIRFQVDPRLALQPAHPQGGGIGDITLGQIGNSFLNTGAGVVTGLGSLADAAARPLGTAMGAGADMIGLPNWIGNNLRNARTIGGTMENLVPTSQQPGGALARFGGEMVGGIGSMPAKVVDNVVGGFAGRTPQNFRGWTDPAAVEAARSAQALNIRMPRFVAGGPTAQRAGNVMEQTPFGTGPIRTGVQSMLDDSQRARDVIASRVGNPMTDDVLGEAGLAAGNRGFQRVKTAAKTRYRQADALAAGVTIAPQATIQKLGELARLDQAVPGGTTISPVISRYVSAFENGGPITIDGARKMRSELGRRFLDEAKLSPSDAKRLTNEIMGAVNVDIATAFTRAGKPQGARLYAEADKGWAAFHDLKDDVLVPYIGRDGKNWGADVARRINQDAKANPTRLSSFLKTLEPDEANNIRATLVDRMGRSSDGQQNAASDAFSLDTFLTNWNGIKATRGRIFDRETLEGLNHLARVASRARDTGRSRNFSNTGSSVMAGATAIPGIAAASVDGVLTGGLTLAATALAQYGGAKLLAAPGFAKKLATMPSNPAAAARYWSSPWVQQMAKTQPVIANDLMGFQSTILQTLNGNMARPGSLAASPDQRGQRGY